MLKHRAREIAIRSFALLVTVGTAQQAMAQDATRQYPTMAPVGRYLMAEQRAEIALARTAAPEFIARHAAVLVLGRHGFERAVKAIAASCVSWGVGGHPRRILTSGIPGSGFPSA